MGFTTKSREETNGFVLTTRRQAQREKIEENTQITQTPILPLISPKSDYPLPTPWLLNHVILPFMISWKASSNCSRFSSRCWTLIFVVFFLFVFQFHALVSLILALKNKQTNLETCKRTCFLGCWSCLSEVCFHSELFLTWSHQPLSINLNCSKSLLVNSGNLYYRSYEFGNPVATGQNHSMIKGTKRQWKKHMVMWLKGLQILRIGEFSPICPALHKLFA